jgi:hypothetical protein
VKLPREVKIKVCQEIDQIEKDIDFFFSDNPLKKEGYAQAVWTLLSVVEDLHIKYLNASSSDEEIHMFADAMLNRLTYPLRVCHKESQRDPKTIRNELNNDHYQFASDWLNSAKDYNYFCSIFPLWHRGEIKITVDRNDLKFGSELYLGKEYEAYNRIVHNEGKPVLPEQLLFPDKLKKLILGNTTKKEDWFKVNFNPKLVSQLVTSLSSYFSSRYSLPEKWKFHEFSLEEYQLIFSTLQSMVWAWLMARIELLPRLHALGYKSSIWVIKKEELLARLKRYTSIKIQIIEKVLNLITFGSSGIREPDIAIQPLLNLENGFCALSPLVWLHTNAERNLCVLLNQIPEQKEIYSRLKNKKESILKEEIKQFFSSSNLSFHEGDIDGTNLDIAIIDRMEKSCLCLELKWFIEPAETREINARTQELKKGVAQATKIKALFNLKDERLTINLLKIDSSYTFQAAIASLNWIGHADAQDENIPIIKLWPLMHKIKEIGSLKKVIKWLSKKEYLPKKGIDFDICPVDISYGEWRAKWYGIKPL